MQRVTLVRYTTRPERTAENEKLANAVFQQLRNERPEGVAYALLRDGNEFVHVFVNLKADDAAALTELPTFKAFTAGIEDRCDVKPATTRLAAQLLESYGFRAGASS